MTGERAAEVLPQASQPSQQHSSPWFTLPARLPPCGRVISSGGVSVRVDTVSYEFLRGAKVDYSQELIRASFQVR